MPEAGDVVDGKYRLTKMIAEGGMATVWEAKHESLKTLFALKFLGKPDVANPNIRFLEEARAAAAVKHRNVIDIVDVGSTKDGTAYLVMELLETETLADRIDSEAPMDIREAIELATQLLGALVAVHEHGIVHRDLKPENVLFGRDTDGRYPKLVDFGISKDLTSKGEEKRRPKTKAGIVLGTPEYMSPEQAAGVEDLDHRSDLYGVGVLLYEMLTGYLPFDAERTSTLLLQVIAGEAESMERYRDDLPTGLVEVVERSMRVEPEDRYANARDMRAALLAAAETIVDKPVTDDADPTTGDAERNDEPEEVATSAAEEDPERERPTVARPAPDKVAFSADSTKKRANDNGIPRWSTLLWVAGAVVLFGLPELLSPGFYHELIVGLADAGAGAANEAQPDAGTPEPAPSVVDSDGIDVLLKNIPPGTVIILDDVQLSEESIGAMRRPDGSVLLPVPFRRGPFELRLQREGYHEWRIRRWPTRDYDFEVVFHRE